MKGVVSSALFNGEAELTPEKDGLTIDALFSAETIDYADMTAMLMENNTVKVITPQDTFMFSGMGGKCEWLYLELWKAYNDTVKSALLVSGECLLETKGRVAYDGVNTDGKIQVFKDCLCLLPHNNKARRIPLVFINGIQKDGFSITVSLVGGEQYVFSMLGRDQDPLEKAIVDGVRGLQQSNGTFLDDLCPGLGVSEKTKAVRLFPQGVATPLKQLSAFPLLEKAVIEKIKGSKMQQTWQSLMGLCDGQKACIGIKELPEEEVERLKQEMMEKASAQQESGGGDAAVLGAAGGPQTDAAGELTEEEEDALRWVLWAAVPSVDGRMAVVEFALPDEAAATYIFRVDGAWNSFMVRLNRCMEATDLNREVIALSEEKLMTPEHRNDRILVSRTPALAALRRQFAGKVIHRSAESWVAGVKGYVMNREEG